MSWVYLYKDNLLSFQKALHLFPSLRLVFPLIHFFKRVTFNRNVPWQSNSPFLQISTYYSILRAPPDLCLLSSAPPVLQSLGVLWDKWICFLLFFCWPLKFNRLPHFTLVYYSFICFLFSYIVIWSFACTVEWLKIVRV